MKNEKQKQKAITMGHSDPIIKVKHTDQNVNEETLCSLDSCVASNNCSRECVYD